MLALSLSQPEGRCVLGALELGGGDVLSLELQQRLRRRGMPPKMLVP